MKNIDKILQVIEQESISMSDFERQAGMSNGYLKNTRDRKADVTKKILDRFREKSPELFRKVFGAEPHINNNGRSAEDQVTRMLQEASDYPNMTLVSIQARLITLEAYQRTNRKLMATILGILSKANPEKILNECELDDLMHRKEILRGA